MAPPPLPHSSNQANDWLSQRPWLVALLLLALLPLLPAALVVALLALPPAALLLLLYKRSGGGAAATTQVRDMCGLHLRLQAASPLALAKAAAPFDVCGASSLPTTQLRLLGRTSDGAMHSLAIALSACCCVGAPSKPIAHTCAVV